MTETSSTEAKPLKIFAALDQFIWTIASRFGDKAKEADRFIKFAIVGGFGAIVDFATLNILEMTVFPPTGANEATNVALATGIAFTLAVINNFIFNRYWTFPDSRSRSITVQLSQFFAVSIVGLIFRLIFVSLTYPIFADVVDSVFSPDLDQEGLNQIGSNISQAISILIVLFWNFFANRYWTYNDIDDE